MKDTMCGLVKEVNAPSGLVYHTDLPIPEINDDEVLIKVHCSAICGTDQHIYDWTPWAQERLHLPLPLAALPAAGAGYLLGEWMQADYFGPGVLTVLVFALCRQWHIGRLPELAAMLVINGWLLPSADMTLWGVTLPVELLATAALLPIWLYRGRQGPHGPVLQGIWYAFYPAHLLLLWWLARSIGI